MLIYRPDFSGNLYRKPNIIAIGYLVFAATVAGYLWYSLSSLNRQRETAAQNQDQEKQLTSDETDTEFEKERLGDRHPAYRYQF